MANKRRIVPPENSLPRDTALLIKFIRFTNEFRRIKRMIWYPGCTGRERNGEHCFQVALVGWFVRERFAPHLALLKVIMYALVHDLVETYAGDTPAFIKSTQKNRKNVPRHFDKVEREAQALVRIRNDFPDLATWIERYEEKKDEESKLVYALDKFVAEANIYLDKGRTDKYLEVTLREKDEYKTKRISVHPLILKHYQALVSYIASYRPDAQFVT